MGMTVGQEAEEDQEVMSAINTTPLVDVMLVLLIIFLITIPVVIQQVPMELPKERNVPTQTKPENIVISINKDGDVFWGMELRAQLEGALREAEDGRGAWTRSRRSTCAPTRTRATSSWAAWSRPASAPRSSRSASSPSLRPATL